MPRPLQATPLTRATRLRVKRALRFTCRPSTTAAPKRLEENPRRKSREPGDRHKSPGEQSQSHGRRQTVGPRRSATMQGCRMRHPGWADGLPAARQQSKALSVGGGEVWLSCSRLTSRVAPVQQALDYKMSSLLSKERKRSVGPEPSLPDEDIWFLWPQQPGPRVTCS